MENKFLFHIPIEDLVDYWFLVKPSLLGAILFY